MAASKYQVYTEYKDSGVEWLGDIPEHWSIKKHKYVSSFTKGKNPTELFDEKKDGCYPYLSMDYLRGLARPKFAFFNKGMYLVKGNEPLIIWDGSNAGEFVKSEQGILSSTMAACHLKKVLMPSFYWYVCLCIEPEMRKHANGMGIPHVNGDELKNIHLVSPTDEEQTQIANFLDHETAKIDTLIDKQQQLINLLKEKRQAVISHAVTKGLNPQAPMKDSGIEWLGDVPEHWAVSRLKYHTSEFEQGWSPQCDSRPAEDNEYGVLKVGCVNHGRFNKLENKALPKELVPQLKYTLRKNDLLISRANTKELVGSAAVIEQDYDHLILCDKLYRLKFDAQVIPQLVSYYLSISVVRQQIELGATGASHSMQNIGQSTIKELFIPVVPKGEAIDLLVYINDKIKLFNDTLSETNKLVTLLQERRTALISAAVTGKIDVRDWQASDSN